MTMGYIVFFALGSSVFFFLGKFGMPVRIAVALAVFIIPSIVLTMWVVHTGDKPLPGAINIVPKSSGKTDSIDDKAKKGLNK